MAGELHSPPDDGARARADDVDGEQVRADALADRIAAYAPAGSDARVPARTLDGALLVPVAPEIAARLGADWSEPVQFRLVERGDGYEMILRKVAAEVDRLRDALGRLVNAIGSAAVVHLTDPGPIRLIPDEWRLIEAEAIEARAVLGLDPDCSLCAAGHVPVQPCAEVKP